MNSFSQWCVYIFIVIVLTIILHYHLNNRVVLYTHGPLYAGSVVQLFTLKDDIEVIKVMGRWMSHSNGQDYFINENPYTRIQTWQTQFSGSLKH